MASAKKIPVPEYSVELTLTSTEARVLRNVLEKIGGDPVKTHRGLMDNINTALDLAGVELYYHGYADGRITGEINIRN